MTRCDGFSVEGVWAQASQQFSGVASGVGGGIGVAVGDGFGVGVAVGVGVGLELDAVSGLELASGEGFGVGVAVGFGDGFGFGVGVGVARDGAGETGKRKDGAGASCAESVPLHIDALAQIKKKSRAKFHLRREENRALAAS